METQALLQQIERWVEDSGLSPDVVMQNTVQALQDNMAHYHWTGIYLLEGDTLILGPYVGKHTDHTRIPVGKGVCGTAVAQNQNQLVGDVKELENYLACSLETRAEIVVLIRDGERILGQIDIDSDAPNAFAEEDEQFLEQVAALLSRKLSKATTGKVV